MAPIASKTPCAAGDTLDMVSLVRNALVSLLLLSVGAAPALLEYCATSCETHKAAAHGTSQPACHHSATSSSEIAPPASPFGHDHTGFVAALSANGVAPAPQFQLLAVLTSLAPSTGLSHATDLVVAAAPPGPPSAHSVRSLPLRV